MFENNLAGDTDMYDIFNNHDGVCLHNSFKLMPKYPDRMTTIRIDLIKSFLFILR